jgi:hypothetical protein
MEWPSLVHSRWSRSALLYIAVGSNLRGGGGLGAKSILNAVLNAVCGVGV